MNWQSYHCVKRERERKRESERDTERGREKVGIGIILSIFEIIIWMRSTSNHHDAVWKIVALKLLGNHWKTHVFEFTT